MKNKLTLSEIPEKSKLKVKIAKDNKWHNATFHHLDGMYSYCTLDNRKENNVFHLYCLQPMKKVGDHYELDK